MILAYLLSHSPLLVGAVLVLWATYEFRKARRLAREESARKAETLAAQRARLHTEGRAFPETHAR